MSLEIERKFIVKQFPQDDYLSSEVTLIKQGYLCLGHQEVRLSRDKERSSHFLTVKQGSGLVRCEEEISLDKKTFLSMWDMIEGGRLIKMRWIFKYPAYNVSVDVYEGSLEGLLIAEVEFVSMEQANSFIPPDWFGLEVTDDPRYKNNQLAVNRVIPTTH